MYIRFDPPLPAENFYVHLEKRILKEVRVRMWAEERMPASLQKLIKKALLAANHKGYAGDATRTIAENKKWWVETTGGYVGGCSISVHQKFL